MLGPDQGTFGQIRLTILDLSRRVRKKKKKLLTFLFYTDIFVKKTKTTKSLSEQFWRNFEKSRNHFGS
jgi:hypothetical protein